MRGRIQLIEVPADSLLGLEGDLESCVYFIATGRLKVFKQASAGEFGSPPTPQVGTIIYYCIIHFTLPSVLLHTLSAHEGSPLCCLPRRILWCDVCFDW